MKKKTKDEFFELLILGLLAGVGVMLIYIGVTTLIGKQIL